MINLKQIGIKNYGSIPHMPGSKPNLEIDKKINEGEYLIYTQKLLSKFNKIYIDEKVDGSNVGVWKYKGELIPTLKKGYNVLESDRYFLKSFSDYVKFHHLDFDRVLREGERIVGEWMIKTHSLQYNLPHEPFIAFDIFDTFNNRISRNKFIDRIDCLSTITRVNQIHSGKALSIDDAFKLLGMGTHGCLEQPEGLVYRLEYRDTFVSMAKFVRNLEFNINYMNDPIYNTWKGSWQLSKEAK